VKRNEIVLCLLFLLPAFARSQPGSSVPFKRHEFFLGYGRAQSYERQVLGYVNRIGSEPEPLPAPTRFFDFGYYLNFTRNMALGFQGNRWWKTFPDAYAVYQNGVLVRYLPVHMTVTNVGLRGRVIPFPGIAEPYAFFGGNRITGSLTSEVRETAKLKGFTFGYGGGLNVHLEPWVSLGLEVLRQFGAAHWEKGYTDEFDPSLLAVTGHIAFRF